MKLYSKIIHKVVSFTHTEFIFISLKEYFPFFIKFIPLPSNYNNAKPRIVLRDNVSFNLLLKDYMQWHVYADLIDISWKKANEYIIDNSCIIDVGANCGAFTLKLAQKSHERIFSGFKIYSFEPNPSVFATLEENLN